MKKTGILAGLLRGTALSALSAGAMGLLTCAATAQTTQTAGSAPSANQMTEGGLATASGESRASGITAAQVAITNETLLQASKDEDNWPLYGRTYDNQRFSPLKQIDTRTVKNLVPVALIQTEIADTFEDSPIEVNGVLYVITANDHVQAYNAVSGKILWQYNPQLHFSDLCCGPEARGVAVAYGKVYVAQLDASLVALNARTGAVEWKTDPATTLPAPSQYSFTAAPQVYDNKVIIGSAGAEYPTRGFVAAFNAQTGKPIWIFRTIAAPGQPGGDSWSGDSWKTGGGSVWNTPAVDPKNGLVLFGVGNPNPDNWGESRKGANAYTRTRSSRCMPIPAKSPGGIGRCPTICGITTPPGRSCSSTRATTMARRSPPPPRRARRARSSSPTAAMAR